MNKWQEIVVRHALRREMLKQVDFPALSDEEKAVFEEELNRRCDEMKEFDHIAKFAMGPDDVRLDKVPSETYVWNGVGIEVENDSDGGIKRTWSVPMEDLVVWVDKDQQEVGRVYHVPFSHGAMRDYNNWVIFKELQLRGMIKVSENNTADITGLVSEIRRALGVEMEYISKMLSEFRTSSIMRELERRGLIMLVNESDTTDSYNMSDLLSAFMDMKNEN